MRRRGVRKGEIEAIKDWIETMPADSEENLIAIGDFNANPSGQPNHFEDVIQTNNLFRIQWYESASQNEDSIKSEYAHGT